MKVFVTGATGAIGAQLIPQLVARGHDVVGMTRWRTSRDAVRALGAQPVVADALDDEAVWHAVMRRRAGDRRPPGDRAARRDEHAPHRPLLRGDQPPAHRGHRPSAGGRPAMPAARRFVAQSYAGWPFARTGGPVKSEDDPLDPDPPAALREPLEAIRHPRGRGDRHRLNQGHRPPAPRHLLRARDGISADPDATMTKPVLKRQFPLVGAAGGVWSFVHIADAATATVEAIEHGAPRASTRSSTTSRRP